MSEILSKKVASDLQICEELQKQDWKDLWPKLQSHTIKILRVRYKVRLNKEDMQQRSRQIVSDVLNLVFLDKTRKWNLTEYETLDQFLYSVIDSFINNSFHTKKKEITGQEDSVFENRGSALSAQQNISANELRAQIVQELQALNADDNEMMVFECLFDGIVTPENIREELGISESDFHNIWRKVNRKREKIKSKLSNYEY